MEETSTRLKFRMWNEGIKKMTYFDNPRLTFEMPENRKDGWPTKSLLAFYLAEGSALYFGNYKYIMQCIGICDRNGKPIYDEDIIEFATTEGDIFRRKVAWDDKLLCYTVGGFPYMRLHESGYIQPSKLVCDVIGNVFENPELLEKNNESNT
ncbi:MAG: YopX family protein [Treponema sp.]|jgi:hypothetical protein|nr:YopX family protein [Treponema sp.]